ncbi:MAG: rod shape-determining protein [Oscillospiraceae bacterium]|nr:rod shape-determining protein [Oscillospiraceae bacterium]
MIFGKDFGIDLGTSNVIIYMKGKGIVLREPAVVAVDKNTGKLLGVGLEAQKMLGRTPGNIIAISPLQDGVISDYEMTERMLREFIRKITSFSLLKPRLLITIPGNITEVQERAVIDAGMQSGARKVYLIEETVAAAHGAGLDIAQPAGRMLVDIGGGTTDIAVLSLSGVVESSSINIAGNSFDEAIIKYVKRKHNILIGERTAEEIKINLGCVYHNERDASMEVRGRCMLTGLPKMFTIHSDEMLDAFTDVTEDLLDAIRSVLETTPPELVADIAENGITVTGGGSLVRGIDKLIEANTNIKTRVAEEPETCAANGAGKALEWLNDMQEGTINLARRKQMM